MLVKKVKNMKPLITRYLVLVIFVAIWFIGLFIRYVLGSNSWFWDFWQTVDVAFAVALGVMAFLAYGEFIKSEDEINIYFKVDGIEHDTGLSLLRKDCTRGEILGVLGMMQRTTKERFSFDAQKLPMLLKEIQEIQKGNQHKVLVDMSTDEFEQFVI